MRKSDEADAKDRERPRVEVHSWYNTRYVAQSRHSRPTAEEEFDRLIGHLFSTASDMTSEVGKSSSVFVERVVRTDERRTRQLQTHSVTRSLVCTKLRWELSPCVMISTL